MSAQHSNAASQLVEDIKGYPKIRILHGSGKASAEVYLNGATLSSWKVLEQELIFMSPKAVYAVGKALRGGIPVVFPQFGPGKLPQHGFARNKLWQHSDTSSSAATDDVTATFTLSQDSETLAVFPHRFTLTLSVTLSASGLRQQLVIDNTGSDAFDFTTLLHTYLRISDIAAAKIHGLSGLHYVDKVHDGKLTAETANPILITEETDRVYENAVGRLITVSDEQLTRRLQAEGFNDVVLWNPAAVKAAAMADLGVENWRGFVCVEVGSVSKPVTLPAGQRWEGKQSLSIE